jgi:hypothetical protein
MRRRDFVALLGGAMAWPSLARTQDRPVAIIGFLNAGSAAGWGHLVAAFRKGLAETGYIEEQNVRIEYRWAASRPSKITTIFARHSMSGPCKSWIKVRNPNSPAYLRISDGTFRYAKAPDSAGSFI